jgi:hypothetical protein
VHITSRHWCPKGNKTIGLTNSLERSIFHNTKEALKLGQTAVPTQENKDLLVKLRDVGLIKQIPASDGTPSYAQ